MSNITLLGSKSASNRPNYKNYAITPPANKGELDRVSMLHYVKARNNVEDVKWFLNLVKENTIIKKNNLNTSETYKSINLRVVREEFAVRFFYPISDKAKREARHYDFFDDLADLETMLSSVEEELTA